MAVKLKKDAVYQEVKLDIVSGRYPVNTKLPKEIDFARERGVSFITMRAALKQLEADGLIARIPSKGTFVIRTTPEIPPAKVRHVLLLQPDYEAASGGGNLFNRDLILGAVEQAYLYGCEVVAEKIEDAGNLLARFSAGEFDGIIWDRADARLHDVIDQLRQAGVAQVTVNRSFDGIPALACDYPEGMRAAMRYLRGIGHRHIGLIDQKQDIAIFRERQQAFLEELQFDGIAEEKNYLFLLTGHPTPDYLFIAERMREMPQITALLVSNVYLPELARYLESAAVSVPQHLSIIQQGEIEGFSRDSDSIFSIFTDPRRAIGSRALAQVLAQLDGARIPVGMEKIVGELIIRKSCALPRHFNGKSN